MIQEAKPKPERLNHTAAFAIGSLASATAVRWPEYRQPLSNMIGTLASELEACDQPTMQASAISKRHWPELGNSPDGKRRFVEGLIWTAVVQCLSYDRDGKQCLVEDLKTIAAELATQEG